MGSVTHGTSEIREHHIYEVISNTDTCEGRGSPVTLFYVDGRDLAIQLAKGKGIFGNDAAVKPCVIYTITMPDGTIRMVGEPIKITSENPEDVKRRALAKLTDDEKAVLGYR